MSSILDPIRAEVQKLTTVVDSNHTLLVLLSQKVLDAPTLEEAQAVAQAIKDQADELAADVVANTPAAPPSP